MLPLTVPTDRLLMAAEPARNLAVFAAYVVLREIRLKAVLTALFSTS